MSESVEAATASSSVVVVVVVLASVPASASCLHSLRCACERECEVDSFILSSHAHAMVCMSVLLALKCACLSDRSMCSCGIRAWRFMLAYVRACLRAKTSFYRTASTCLCECIRACITQHLQHTVYALAP
jgi:hypothetical protein